MRQTKLGGGERDVVVVVVVAVRMNRATDGGIRILSKDRCRVGQVFAAASELRWERQSEQHVVGARGPMGCRNDAHRRDKVEAHGWTVAGRSVCGGAGVKKMVGEAEEAGEVGDTRMWPEAPAGSKLDLNGGRQCGMNLVGLMEPVGVRALKSLHRLAGLGGARCPDPSGVA